MKHIVETTQQIADTVEYRAWGKHRKTRLIIQWRVKLECGHFKTLKTKPGKTSRCLYCEPVKN